MRDDLLPEIKDGFSFSCQKCGECCANEGFIFLYDNEILKIAKKLKLSLQECITQYTEVINSEYKILDQNLERTGKKIFLLSLVLKQGDDGSCILLDHQTHMCKIYAVRPYQCRSWPKWHPLMTIEKELREAKEKCPGFRSSDGFISQSQILRSLENELSTEYKYVKKMRRNGNDIRKLYRYLKNIKF